ncbi:MAG TPA: glycosyltransferase family 2 protein [Chloroflexota bacterium]|nr:glycosyltransferase family 2 protein [Chloroflexota bacterium]HUM68812.1 glycosyltransferase family 2 protein [Chloroflexota bacterium]
MKMNHPKVSIITPVYNGAEFLGETIQSVLAQTYHHFEYILVDDVSPDDSASVVEQFDDSRLKYIRHEENLGADRARLTGLQASSGEIIAFLDQDDFFHPEKLQVHVAYLKDHPDVGFTYNGRFELNFSEKTIRDIWRPPEEITLADLVLWFPLAPSDVVLRRDWALKIDMAKGSRGAEILHFSHLYMAGCKFANVGRVLNYRRHHSGRIIRNLAAACQSELNNQDKIFDDDRCPPEVLALRPAAHANMYMYWGYMAYAQNEVGLGQQFLRQAVQLKPAILRGQPGELVVNLLTNCIADERLNHESLLRDIFSQLPLEATSIVEKLPWAIAQGYLLKGTRAVIWDRPADAERHFRQAARLNAQIDEAYMSAVSYHLLGYEAEYGPEATQIRLRTLASYLNGMGTNVDISQLISYFWINRAFQRYNQREYSEVPGAIFQAVVNNPRYMTNRGVISTLFRSVKGLNPK